jgi:hypothetical protein
MAIKRLQNRVTQSRLTLPVVSLFSLMIWIVGGLISNNLWINFICFALSTYLMVELNNVNALIRTYSRSVSCSFIILFSSANFLFTSMQGSILQLCIIAFYLLFFKSYQDKHSMSWIFFAFFCLSMGSLVFVQILYFVPILWLFMIINIRTMSGKTFIASVIGIMAPYWFWIGYLTVTGDICPLIEHVTTLIKFTPLSLKRIPFNQFITLIFILLIATIGIIHYLRTSYNDKIKVRMLFEIFIVMDIISIIFIALQPNHYDLLLRLIVINTSPLIAHYITLTRTWITNISFVIILIAAMILTAYNLWMPSFSF